MNRDSKLKYLIPILVFIFPFIYYLRFLVPSSALLVMGGDFPAYYMFTSYFVEFISNGLVPLWGALDNGGHPFISHPYTAPFYPLNALLVIIYKVFGFYHYGHHQYYTVLAFALFSLGIYFWIRSLNKDYYSSAFSAIVASLSWCITDNLRYPIAPQTLAWLPWVLFSISKYNSTKKLRYIFMGIFFQFCIITAGYSYFIPYFYMLFVVYEIYNRFFYKYELRDYVNKLGFYLLPMILATPYLKMMLGYLALANREIGVYSYGVSRAYGPVDLLGAFVMPAISSLNGAAYIGVFPLLLIFVYFLYYKKKYEKIFILSVLLIVIMIAFADRSYVLTLLWHTTPLKSFREFVRVLPVLVVVLAIPISRGYRLFVSRILASVKEPLFFKRLLWILFGISLMQLLFIHIADVYNSDLPYLLKFAMPNIQMYDFVGYTLLTMFMVTVLCHVNIKKNRFVFFLIFVVLLLFSTLDIGTYGRKLWGDTVAHKSRRFDDVKKQISKGASGTSLVKATAKSSLDAVNKYFEIDRSNLSIMKRIVPTDHGIEMGAYVNSYEYMKQNDLLDTFFKKEKIFFLGAINYDDLSLLKAEANKKSIDYTVEYFDGNQLNVSFEIYKSGYFVWIDNYHKNWSVTLDGVSVPMEKFLGTFKGVRVDKPGKHSVVFKYSMSYSIYIASLAMFLTLLVMLVLFNKYSKNKM